MKLPKLTEVFLSICESKLVMIDQAVDWMVKESGRNNPSFKKMVKDALLDDVPNGQVDLDELKRWNEGDSSLEKKFPSLTMVAQTW